MTDELKDCPFCGSKAELIRTGRNEYLVKCQKGGCCYGSSAEENPLAYTYEEDAIKLWNTRHAAPQLQPDKVKELETVLEAWYSVFGTTQLTHAQARLEEAEKKTQLQPIDREVRSEIVIRLMSGKFGLTLEMAQDIADYFLARFGSALRPGEGDWSKVSKLPWALGSLDRPFMEFVKACDDMSPDKEKYEGYSIQSIDGDTVCLFGPGPKAYENAKLIHQAIRSLIGSGKVRLPEKNPRYPKSDYVQDLTAYNQGYNQAIDDVARLNQKEGV